MKLSPKAQNIFNKITADGTKPGELRNLAKEIKKDHSLAIELWSTGALLPRLLSILIMDKKELTPDVIDNQFNDIETHQPEERTQLSDWFMANQLTKDKKLTVLMETWENDVSPLKRRLFWYHQARLRWVGQTPPDNTKELLRFIEAKIMKEAPEVQWAMNFTAGWIGIFDLKYRSQCVKLGEKYSLYKDEMVSKNCTPNYLPEFIEMEVKKRGL